MEESRDSQMFGVKEARDVDVHKSRVSSLDKSRDSNSCVKFSAEDNCNINGIEVQSMINIKVLQSSSILDCSLNVCSVVFRRSKEGSYMGQYEKDKTRFKGNKDDSMNVVGKVDMSTKDKLVEK